MTDDWKDRAKPSIPKEFRPNAVIETKTTFSNGTEQIDRTIYNAESKLWKQVHSGPHNRPDKHPYGVKGEHWHIYTWGEDGTLVSREVGELTEQDRKEHADILGGVTNDG